MGQPHPGTPGPHRRLLDGKLPYEGGRRQARWPGKRYAGGVGTLFETPFPSLIDSRCHVSQTAQPVEKVGVGPLGCASAREVAHGCTTLAPLGARAGIQDDRRSSRLGVFQQAGPNCWKNPPGTTWKVVSVTVTRLTRHTISASLCAIRDRHSHSDVRPIVRRAGMCLKRSDQSGRPPAGAGGLLARSCRWYSPVWLIATRIAGRSPWTLIR
ncbi:MAG: hypothetical protein QOJ59_5009 [Thermomicrobiales bacterium]|nr:hypothetical protein [Thermomicrobiales bacterium]